MGRNRTPLLRGVRRHPADLRALVRSGLQRSESTKMQF